MRLYVFPGMFVPPPLCVFHGMSIGNPCTEYGVQSFNNRVDLRIFESVGGRLSVSSSSECCSARDM